MLAAVVLLTWNYNHKYNSDIKAYLENKRVDVRSFVCMATCGSMTLWRTCCLCVLPPTRESCSHLYSDHFPELMEFTQISAGRWKEERKTPPNVSSHDILFEKFS